jgi:signal transduction histidine kinase
MNSAAAPSHLQRVTWHLKRVYAWPRLRVVALACGLWIALFAFTWEAPYWMLIFRLSLVGMVCLTAFGVFEVWPMHLPNWLARWALQVIGVAVAVPITVVIGYHVTTLGLDPPWWRDRSRLEGVFAFTFLGMIAAPWMAVAALLKQIREDARKQALQFQLERSELERNALNARLSLLQAQVQPHFLFNTLANVRELVVTGSPRAATVLENLIAYLRAAVPRLDNTSGTIAEEIDRTRAYLEIMYMRMPDRLNFSFDVAPEALQLACPPMSILTLVENAVRHGIDPAEEGGRIAIVVRTHRNALDITVSDTGVGMGRPAVAHAGMRPNGLGTGIDSLRERLQLAFGPDAKLALATNTPRGVTATMHWTVER